MIKFYNFPIRIQLVILALLLTLPALGIIVFSGLKERDTDYLGATVESQKLADHLSAEMMNLVDQAQLVGAILSELPDVKNRNVQQVQSILEKTAQKYPKYSILLISDAKGEIWASSHPLPAHISVADRLYFQKAKASLRPSSGEFVNGKATRTPAFHIAYPLHDKGVFRGVIVMSFNLGELRSILQRSQLSRSSNYIVTDNKGIILTRGKELGAAVGTRIQLADLHKMEKGSDKGTYEFSRYDGDRRIVTYRKLWMEGEQAPYLYIRAGLPIKESLSKANINLIYNVAVLLLCVSFAFAVVLFIGKRSIVDRVVLLEQAAQRLAKGDLDYKVAGLISGGELGRLGQTFDDTAQQLVLREQALQESERNYRDIFNMTHDAIFVHDEDSGRILEANVTAERMFGFDGEEMLRLCAAPPDASEPPHSIYGTLHKLQLSTKGESKEFEWLFKGKKGESCWIEVVQVATNIAGKKRVLSVVRDITERKEVERIKEEMLSAVSHEMRTPLTAMLGFLEFIMENHVEAAELREYVGIMHKEAERLSVSINNFLDMQRLKAKWGSYLMGPLEVLPLLSDAAAIFSISKTNHVELSAMPSDLPPVFGAEPLLHQALCNLVSNALKYSPEGSRVTLGALADGDSVTLWVKDSGIGIPADSLSKIFDTFYRVDNTSTRRTNGTGLGLAIVKEIVDKLNGRVWAESTPGAGSVFYISLPTAAHAQVKAETPSC